MFLTAQILGLIGAIVLIVSIQFEHKKNIIISIAIANMLFVISFLLLNAYSGAIICLIAAIEAIINYAYDVKKKKFPKILIPIYVIVPLIFGIIIYKTYVDILPIICSMLSVLLILQTKEKYIRIITWISIALWIAYDMLVAAYTTMVSDVFFLISTTISIIRYDILQNKLKTKGIDFFKKLEEFTINSNKNFLLEDTIELENGKMIYSNMVEDYFWNFIVGINVKDREEFERVWEENRKYMIEKNRQPVFYITPSSNILDNYEKILPEYMKIESKEVWMMFDDFKNLKPYEENKNIDIQIEKNTDLKEFADVFMESYSSDSDEDPYGQLAENYRQVIVNFDKEKNREYIKNFYIAKHDNEGVAVTISIVKGDMALISSVGTVKEYRNKGICQTLMNRVLNDLKKENVNIAFLQTEEGFIPEKLYKKIGFKTVCNAIIAVEK